MITIIIIKIDNDNNDYFIIVFMFIQMFLKLGMYTIVEQLIQIFQTHFCTNSQIQLKEC